MDAVELSRDVGTGGSIISAAWPKRILFGHLE
jgi:hypothetical protein